MKIRASFPALFCCLTAGLPLLANAAPAQVTVATVAQKTLPNGLKVLVWPRHTAPVVTTMMWYHVGSRDEMPGYTGIAHFLEHLMFKGTQKLTKGAIDRITYQNGGSNNAFTFNDHTAYEFNFPKQKWTAALQIEADRMRNCTFEPKEFEAERQVVMEERRIGQDDPPRNFDEQVNCLLWNSHPYRNPVIGWMEDIKRLPRETVREFYMRYYVPANATLVVTGDISPSDAFAAVEKAFAVVPKLPAPVRRVVVEPPATALKRIRMAQPTQVSRLGMLFRMPARKSPDVPALRVLQYALGEGKLSRLYQRLVEKDQSAADVDTGLGIYRESGELEITANLKAGATLEKLESAVWEELERIKTTPITDQELERAKNQFYSDWLHGLATANALANALGEADSLGSYQDLGRMVPRVQAVRAADVLKVAKTYLKQEHAAVGHLIPDGKKPAGDKEEASALCGLGPVGRTVKPVVRPEAGNRQTAVTFAPLKPLEKVLPNGMRLILLENHDLPSVTVTSRINAGAYEDPEAKAGLANLVARMLDEGTTTRSHEQIAAALEQVGASFVTAAAGETSETSLQSLSRYTDSLLPLYAELMRAPSFAPDRLEQERGRLLVELKEEQDEASVVARQAFRALIYGEHPAHRPTDGKEETVRAITREDLAEYHSRYYRPDMVTLAAVGDFSAPAMLEKLTTVFGDWQASGAPPTHSFPPPVKQTDVRTKRIPMDKTQTVIVLGHLGVTRTNPDYIPLKVMDTILGEGVSGGFTARIPYQLRDVQGLAYSVGSSITSSVGKEPGVFSAALGTEPVKEPVAVKALLKEIAKIRTAPVTETELREAEGYLSNSYVFDFQTSEQLAHYLLAVQYFGLGYDYRQRFPREVLRVTRADVERVAKKYLDPEHYTLVVVGPEKAAK